MAPIKQSSAASSSQDLLTSLRGLHRKPVGPGRRALAAGAGYPDVIWGVRKELFQPKLVRGHRYLQGKGLFWRIRLSQPDAHPIV